MVSIFVNLKVLLNGFINIYIKLNKSQCTKFRNKNIIYLYYIFIGSTYFQSIKNDTFIIRCVTSGKTLGCFLLE